MKKDIQNVVITFSLIALMLYGGSFFYTKKVRAEEVAQRAEEERLVQEFEAQALMQAQLLKINAQQERLLAEAALKAEQKKLEAEEMAKAEAHSVVATIPKSAIPVQTASEQVTVAAQQTQIQAQLDAQAKAEADAFAAQVAAAKKAAEKIAQQKADALAQAEADAAAASKKSRRSSAS